MAFSLDKIGLIEYQLGNKCEAIFNFKKSLATRKEIFNNKPHPQIVSSLTHLA